MHTKASLALAVLVSLAACGSDIPTDDDAIACTYLIEAHDGTIDGAKNAMRTIFYFEDKIKDPSLQEKWSQASEDGTFLQFNPGTELDMWYVQLTGLVEQCEEAGHEARG